jgi:hypothetical protein
MVEADSHFKQLSTFILDTYKVFEHIDMLSIGRGEIIRVNPFFCRNWICGLAIALIFIFSSCVPACFITKPNPRGALICQYCNKIPSPPIASNGAKTHHVFITLWQFWQCSCRGAKLAHATASPNFCLQAL